MGLQSVSRRCTLLMVFWPMAPPATMLPPGGAQPKHADKLLQRLALITQTCLRPRVKHTTRRHLPIVWSMH